MSSVRFFNQSKTTNQIVISEELKDKYYNYKENESNKAFLFGVSFVACYLWSVVEIVNPKEGLSGPASIVSWGISLCLAVTKYLNANYSYSAITDNLDSKDAERFYQLGKTMGKQELDEYLVPERLLRPNL